MTDKKLVSVVKPPKPIADMTDEELELFAERVGAEAAALLGDRQGT